MGWDLLRSVLLGALALLVVSAGIEDVRRREIANWKNAAMALLAPAWWVACGLSVWPDMACQAALALVVFALFVGAFALGQMGGGDVKMIGALALWFPFGVTMQILVAMALAGGVLTLVLLAERWWKRSIAAPEIPYGVAIAVAALLAIPRTGF